MSLLSTPESLLSAPESESRISQRRRGRSSPCAHAAQTVPQSRMSGLPAGDRLTLGQVLDSVWEGLCAGGTAECPICRGRLVREAAISAGRDPAVGTGRCERCETTIG